MYVRFRPPDDLAHHVGRAGRRALQELNGAAQAVAQVVEAVFEAAGQRHAAQRGDKRAHHVLEGQVAQGAQKRRGENQPHDGWKPHQPIHQPEQEEAGQQQGDETQQAGQKHHDAGPPPQAVDQHQDVMGRCDHEILTQY